MPVYENADILVIGIIPAIKDTGRYATIKATIVMFGAKTVLFLCKTVHMITMT